MKSKILLVRIPALVFLLIGLISTNYQVGAGSLPAIKPMPQVADMNAYSLIDAVNALRISNGLPAYTINPILMQVAQQQAQYMAAAGVSHFGPGGSTPWQRGLAAGYPLAGDLSLGGFYSENITAGSNKTVQEAVTEWQGDAPHLTTMLSPHLSEIGAGVAIVGDYVYYVIDCASPTSSGQAQPYTAVPGGSPAPGSTAASALVVNTVVPATPENDGRVFHVVKPGETLWLIAVSYGVKIADLRRLNNLAEAQNIFPGNKLFIKQESTPAPLPATQTATTVPVPTSSPTSTVTLAPSPTSTKQPVAPVSTNSSLLALGAIVLAAIVLSVFFVRAGPKPN